MAGELLVSISEPDADAERLDTLARYLREELRDLPLDSISTPAAGELPAGARGIDAAMVGSLLLALGQSADGLKSVIEAVRSWLHRGDSGRTIRLEMDGDALELEGATDAERERLIQLFVERHSAGTQRWTPTAEH